MTCAETLDEWKRLAGLLAVVLLVLLVRVDFLERALKRQRFGGRHG